MYNINIIDDLPFVDLNDIPEGDKHYVKKLMKKLIKGILTENGVVFNCSSYVTIAK